MADQELTVSIYSILRTVMFLVVSIIIPLTGWFLRNSWQEIKDAMKSINTKVDNVSTNVDTLASNFDDFQLDSVQRLTRLETYAETNGHHPPPRPGRRND